jgi:hypothetical protein
LTADNAEDLRDAILYAARTYEAKFGLHDAYGQRYIVDFMLVWHGKQAMIRSAWIIEHESYTPKLTTCYPL